MKIAALVATLVTLSIGISADAMAKSRGSSHASSHSSSSSHPNHADDAHAGDGGGGGGVVRSVVSRSGRSDNNGSGNDASPAPTAAENEQDPSQRRIREAGRLPAPSRMPKTLPRARQLKLQPRKNAASRPNRRPSPQPRNRSAVTRPTASRTRNLPHSNAREHKPPGKRAARSSR